MRPESIVFAGHIECLHLEHTLCQLMRLALYNPDIAQNTATIKSAMAGIDHDNRGGTTALR